MKCNEFTARSVADLLKAAGHALVHKVSERALEQYRPNNGGLH